MNKITKNIYGKKGFFSLVIHKLALYLVKIDSMNPIVRYGLNKKTRKEKIIVSLTSYPGRFDTIISPLKTLLRQSIKPDKIIVWLGSDASPDLLTDKMKKLEKYGIEYRFDSALNLKPHKKYYYAMQEFENDIVITVDDDILYPRSMIKSLIKIHEQYPDYICARRIHRIKKNENGQVCPYNEWYWEVRDLSGNPDPLNFGTNGAGTLFPPHSLSEKAFDSEKIITLCLNADDVWIWFMETLNRKKVIWAPCILVHPPVVELTRGRKSLAKTNVEMNGNDKYVNDLLKEYGRDETIREMFE